MFHCIVVRSTLNGSGNRKGEPVLLSSVSSFIERCAVREQAQGNCVQL